MYGQHPSRGGKVEIITERLILRPVVSSDAASLFSIYGDPATNLFNPAGPYPDILHARTVLHRWTEHRERHGFGHWAIALLDNPDNIIGFGGLQIARVADMSINNLGYRFATQAWGKGLATEFADRAVRYGFETIALTGIGAVVRRNHLASQKVLHNVGLRYIRDIDDVNDAPPSMFFSLRSDEWQKSRMEG